MLRVYPVVYTMYLKTWIEEPNEHKVELHSRVAYFWFSNTNLLSQVQLYNLNTKRWFHLIRTWPPFHFNNLMNIGKSVHNLIQIEYWGVFHYDCRERFQSSFLQLCARSLQSLPTMQAHVAWWFQWDVNACRQRVWNVTPSSWISRTPFQPSHDLECGGRAHAGTGKKY